MRIASTRLKAPMVRYWRRRNASAPSWMASEILRISAVPLSCLRTQRARLTATARASTLSPRTRGISIVSCGSLEPACGGLVSDSQGDRYDARHVLPVTRAGRIEPVRQHALLELPAVARVRDRRVDLDPGDAPVGGHPEAHPIGAAGHGAGNLGQRRQNCRPR